MQYLVDNLACGERTRKAAQAGRAKSATHGTSCLRRNTNSELVAGGHAYRLDRCAVRELQQILAGTIPRDLLYKLGGDIKAVFLGQGFA